MLPPTPAPLTGSVLATRRLVVIGGSAGAIPTLIGILGLMPAGFTLPIVLLQHLSRSAPSRLPEVLGRRTALTVGWAAHGGRPLAGHVHVAPQNRDLVLTAEGRFACLSPGGRSQPSVDRFFESAASVLGRGCIAVVISGMLQDGARGMAAVAACGGITIAQEESGCAEFEMPAAAIDFGRADLVLAPAKIAEALLLLAEEGEASAAAA